MIELQREGTNNQTKENIMDTLGFIFGMSGMTFGLMGFVSGINASSAISSASARIERLEKRLDEAGIASSEGETD